MSVKNMKNTVILIMGAPASGKFSIATKLAEKFENTHVVDNHTVNNMFFKYVDRDVDITDHPVFDYIRDAKAVLRDFLLNEVPDGHNFIFTGCIDKHNVKSYERALNFAKKRGAKFVPITLHCANDVSLERLDTPERAAMMKLTNKDVFLEINEGFETYISKHENQIEIDNSDITLDEAVSEICERAGL